MKHDPAVMNRLMRDQRAMDLLNDADLARASIAAHTHRWWEFGRRWFVIVVVRDW